MIFKIVVGQHFLRKKRFDDRDVFCNFEQGFGELKSVVCLDKAINMNLIN